MTKSAIFVSILFTGGVADSRVYPQGRIQSGRINSGNTINKILDQYEHQQDTMLDEQTRKDLKAQKSLENDVILQEFFPQVYDHRTDKWGDKTWNQRYFLNKMHYKPGGPVFIMIGGEGEISERYVHSDTFLAGYLAKKWQGAVVALEHRFYGVSQPYIHSPSYLKDLSLLHSRQALADLARWVRHLKSELYPNSPFLCMGGSYPGNLAAWFRQLYPDLTVGCFSFSAPVFPKVDYFEYGQVVYDAVKNAGIEKPDDMNLPQKLIDGFNAILGQLESGTEEAKRDMLKKLNACPYSVLSTADYANLESMVTGAISGVVQYNNTLPAGQKIEDFAKLIRDAKTPEDAAWGTVQGLLPQPPNGTCTDYSTKKEYESFEEYFAEPEYAAMRSWVYQTCNEFAYFQIAQNSVVQNKDGTTEEKKTMYSKGVNDPSLWHEMCREVFGITPVQVDLNVEKSREFYDGVNSNKDDPENRNDINFDSSRANHTVFINGQYDPWAALARGVFEDPENHLHGYNIARGSHCVGLYGNPESPLVIDSAKEVQFKLIEIAAKWLGLNKDATRTTQEGDSASGSDLIYN